MLVSPRAAYALFVLAATLTQVSFAAPERTILARQQALYRRGQGSSKKPIPPPIQTSGFVHPHPGTHELGGIPRSELEANEHKVTRHELPGDATLSRGAVLPGGSRSTHATPAQPGGVKSPTANQHSEGKPKEKKSKGERTPKGGNKVEPKSPSTKRKSEAPKAHQGESSLGRTKSYSTGKREGTGGKKTPIEQGASNWYSTGKKGKR